MKTKLMAGLLGIVMAVALPMSAFAATVPMSTGQEPIPAPPSSTFNLGIQALDQRMFRIFQELTRGVSARTTAMDSMDIPRIDALYAELVAAVNQVGINGQTCITDFHYLYEIPLTDMSESVVKVENEAINTAVAYLYGANIALRTSSSTNRNDCLDEPDYTDLMSAVAKSKSWIDSFVANSNPMDMPQSSPSQSIVEPSNMLMTQ